MTYVEIIVGRLDAIQADCRALQRAVLGSMKPAVSAARLADIEDELRQLRDWISSRYQKAAAENDPLAADAQPKQDAQ